MKVETNIETVEKAIGIPAKKWEGHCHEIAALLLEEGVVGGRLRYGHYLGEIKPGTRFAERAIVQHGWIELHDGTVVDPTRWVFEGVDPYIYHGSADEYDVGGNKFRSEHLGQCPNFDATDRVVVLPASEAGKAIQMMLPESQPNHTICMKQLFWLANLPPDMFGGLAKTIYEWLRANDLGGFVPIDNYRLVMGG